MSSRRSTAFAPFHSQPAVWAELAALCAQPEMNWDPCQEDWGGHG